MSKYVNVTFEELMSEIKEYIVHQENLALIEKAYLFAAEKHKDQLRKSGEPYIVHPLQVTHYLVKLHVGPSTLAAALLHDVIEDCDVSDDEFKEMFGQEVFTLVEGVTKIGNIEFKDEKEYQAANHRKIMIAMARDVRVILIKLCDRLHNMRTLEFQPPLKQKKISQETLDVYAPIAHRLGISEIKNELEDLSFMYLNPDKYHEISHLVEQKRSVRDAQVAQMISEIEEVLSAQKIKFRIFGRAKHFYSIYNKMVKKHKRFDEILDLLAIRIVTESDLACYEVLGYIHANYTPIPGRLKDYIAMPKFNMYQSLHTSVINSEGVIFEIQIRTEEMDSVAEQGVAAHWRYKEGKYSAKEEQREIEERLSLLRDIVAIKEEDEVSDERFMETLQKDFFESNVYVMSPKGKVIDLPNGSTPIDFAYRIHTEVGHSTTGAMVNGVLVPLNTVLKTGDVVSLRTSKSSNGPSEDWLKFVKTGYARNKIKNYLVKKEMEDKAPIIDKGQQMLKDELAKRGMNAEWATEKKLETIIGHFNMKDINDFWFCIGQKQVSLSSVIEQIHKKENVNNRGTINLQNYVEMPHRTTSKSGIRVAGIDSIMISLAGCCSPIPGDGIVGFITKGSGVKVHRKDCPNVGKDGGRLIDVEWDSEIKESKYEVMLHIEATDRNYLLSDLITVVSQHKANINAVNCQVSADKINAIAKMKIVVNSVDHLNTIISNLKKVASVTKVERTIQ